MSRFRLWNLPLPAKLLYSFFCGLSLFGVVSCVLLYEDLVGPSLRTGHVAKVAQFYGPSSRPMAVPESTANGPAIVLPEDEAAVPLQVAMPYRKLLEVTHFHLFTVPVLVLILTHLYVLTGASRQLVWVLLAWLSTTFHIAAPWLIRYGSPRLSVLYPISGFSLFLSCVWLCVFPIWVMWRGKPRKTAPETRQQAEEAPLPFSD